MLSVTTASLLNQSRQHLSKLQNLAEGIKRFRHEDEGPGKDSSSEPPAGVHDTIWESRSCCPAPEACAMRHDLLYLESSKKKDYTRTWTECDYVTRTRYICEGTAIPPEREHRLRKVNQPGFKVDLTGDETKLDLRPCVRKPGNGKACPRLTVLPCKLARLPPTCKAVRLMTCCQKRCTLYPSYSECITPIKKKALPVECDCLRVPSMCEVFKYFRKFPNK